MLALKVCSKKWVKFSFKVNHAEGWRLIVDDDIWNSVSEFNSWPNKWLLNKEGQGTVSTTGACRS